MSLTQKVSFIKNLAMDRDLNPLLNDCPKLILEREQLLTTIPLAVGVTVLDPVALLLANTLITDYLKGFKLGKFGVKLRFLLTSSPMYYGIVTVSWAPECVDVASPVYDYGNRDPIVMDISQQDAVVLDIPWTSVLESIAVPYPDAGNTGYLIRLNIEILAYASLDSVAPVPELQVYGSFTNPEFFGAKSQSGRPVQLHEIPSDTQLLPRSSHGRELAVGSREMVPYQHSARQEHSGALTIMSEIGSAVGTVASVLVPEAAPVVGAISFALDMAEYGYDLMQSSLAKYYGREVDSVQSEEPQSVKQSELGNVAGAIYGPTLNMNSHVPEMVPPYHLGDNSFRHKILDIMKLPTLRNVVTFTSNTVPYQVCIEPLSDTTNRPSYMDHWCQCFRYWRGSIKVKLCFFTSPLISAVFQIGMINKLGVEPTLGVLYDYAYKKVVTVRGLTVIDLVVPFVCNIPWWKISSDANRQTNLVSGLYVKLLTAPTSAGSSSGSVFMLPIISAGDDFQVKDLCSPTPSSTFAVSQMHVYSDWKTTQFENLAGTKPLKLLATNFEDSLTCEEASLRYSVRTAGATLSSSLPLPHTYAVDMRNCDLFDFIMVSFRYVRGSRRYKVPNIATGSPSLMMPNTLSRYYPTGYLDGYLWGNGFASNQSFATGGSSWLEYEVPFMNSLDWSHTERATSPIGNFEIRMVTNVSSNSEQNISAGRDYQLAFLMPPFAFMGQYAALLSSPTLKERR